MFDACCFSSLAFLLEWRGVFFLFSVMRRILRRSGCF